MRFVIKSLTVCISILLICSFHAFGQQEDHELISKKFLYLMEQNSFKEAASLFHYPKDYTVEKKESEFKSVVGGLKRIKGWLGNLIQTLNYMPKAEFLGYGVSGADIHYWHKKQKKSPQIMIPCRFEKIDWSLIRITFCNIENRWEIQSVDYSFIKSDESKVLLQKLKNI